MTIEDAQVLLSSSLTSKGPEIHEGMTPSYLPKFMLERTPPWVVLGSGNMNLIHMKCSTETQFLF